MIAIKLLFRPCKEVRVPIIGLRIQGLLPKRHKDIAKKIGSVVEMELLSSKDIFKDVLGPRSIDNLTTMITKVIEERVSKHLPDYVPESISASIKKVICNYLQNEIKEILNDSKHEVQNHMTDSINVAKLIEDRINSFDPMQVEHLVLQVAKGELKHIEVMGAVIGFLIGTVQMILALMM